jgi:nicotinamidase-related amidase
MRRVAVVKNEALLIVDMSNDFVADDGGLTAGKPAQEIVPYIVEQADEFLKNGGQVVVTMDAHEKNDPHFELWPVHNVIGTEGQKLYGDLHNWYVNNAGNDAVHYVPKTNYNAFHNTNLAELLRKQNVEKVHIVGVCTDICDFLTVAGADAEGFKTAAHKRGMATFTDNHELFANQMKLCFHTEIIE